MVPKVDSPANPVLNIAKHSDYVGDNSFLNSISDYLLLIWLILEKHLGVCSLNTLLNIFFYITPNKIRLSHSLHYVWQIIPIFKSILNTFFFQRAFLNYTLKDASLLFLHISGSKSEINSLWQVFLLLCKKLLVLCCFFLFLLS